MMCNSERGPGRNGSPGTTSIGGSELFLFGSQVRHMAEGFFLGAVHSGTSLGITGEMNLDCEMTHEQDIYSDEGPPGEPAPPRTITAHTKNSEGTSECAVEFRFYVRTGENPSTLIATDTVKRGSTPSRTARWTQVTAKCLRSPVENPSCRVSWTIDP